MKSLGIIIKALISKRGITAKELSRSVNLSETSLSKIVQGVSKPRQANLTRIIQELCKSPEEEQQIISAYARIEDHLDDEQFQRDQATFNKIEEERVRRYLQAKSQSIAFREEVAATLDKAGIPYDSPFSNADVICDFLIPGPQRIAIECKSNPTRDWHRTNTSARIILEDLPCNQVIVVVPTLNAIPDRTSPNITVVQVSELANKLENE